MKCCLCYTVQEQYVDLPCQHLFCKQCLAKWAIASHNKYNDKDITCPCCRKTLIHSDKIQHELLVFADLMSFDNNIENEDPKLNVSTCRRLSTGSTDKKLNNNNTLTRRRSIDKGYSEEKYSKCNWKSQEQLYLEEVLDDLIIS